MQLKDVKQRGFVDWCGMPVFAGGWETSRKWSRDFLLFTLLCSLVLQHVDRLAWISHEPSFESENFLKLDWPSRWSTVISSRSHLQVMPCVCHPSPWWPWPRTSFINVTWIAQAGWRKRIRMLNLRERSPPFGAGCLSRTRAYHGLLLPNAHQIGCNWCILYTVSLIIPKSLEKALDGLEFCTRWTAPVGLGHLCCHPDSGKKRAASPQQGILHSEAWVYIAYSIKAWIKVSYLRRKARKKSSKLSVLWTF